MLNLTFRHITTKDSSDPPLSLSLSLDLLTVVSDNVYKLTVPLAIGAVYNLYAQCNYKYYSCSIDLLLEYEHLFALCSASTKFIFIIICLCYNHLQVNTHGYAMQIDIFVQFLSCQ